MTLEIEKVIRKVRPVEAVKVTEDNIAEVAGWCGGLVVPPGHLDNTSDKPYIHVTVRNPRRTEDSQAKPDMWIVKEDFRSFRVLNGKQYRNSYEAHGTSRPASAAPSPKSMPQRKSEDKNRSSSTTPEPAQVGAVAVTPGVPTDGAPQPVPTSPTPKSGVTEKKENNMQGTPEPSEAQTQDSATETSTDDVLHADATDSGDSLNADALSTSDGEARDLSQAEQDADGTEQLGQPESAADADEAPVEDVADSSDEESAAPSLCGQCGSVTVDGVCSNDTEHDVNGQAQQDS
jgi:hypothetical protein